MSYKHWFKIGVLILFIGLIFDQPALVWGQGASNDDVQSLTQKINDSKKKLDDLAAQQKIYLQKINEKQSQKNSLANQLSILNDGLAKSNLELEGNQVEIDRTNLEIKKTLLDIDNKNQAIGRQKDHIADLLKLLYKEQQTSDLEILLLNNSLSDFINQLKYLQNTNGELTQSVDDLQTVKSALENNQNLLLQKKSELTTLQDQLEGKKADIQSEQEDKNYLLTQTDMSEKQYQALLNAAKQQQLKAENEVASLEKAMREKLAKLKTTQDLSYSGFSWPVTKNRITTYFHDPDYPFRNVLGEHPGWDIRAGYGSDIRATANGYVARSTFNGSKNYAYIMVVHGDGLSTVYGHVSASYVKTDDYVVQGQVIGKSGGIPGSPGSGSFCTGPHLHFEIRKDGIPVDPNNYLQ